MVIDRDGQHFFGFVLADDILVKAGFDFGRGQDADILQRIDVVPWAGSRCAPLCGGTRRRGPVLLIQGAVAHVDAVFADVDTWTDNELFDLILGTTAEAADQLSAFSILPGNRICHFLLP